MTESDDPDPQLRGAATAGTYPVTLDLAIPGLNLKAHLTGTATTTSPVAPPTPKPTPTPVYGTSVLPERVAGAYWPSWSKTRLTALPAGYNVVFLAFAVDGESGAVHWVGLDTLNQNDFVADVKAMRARGVAVVLSVGGAGSPITLDTDAKVNAFVKSVDVLYQAYGGFDGLDWDIESPPIDPARFATASRALKAMYGPKFAICMSFAGNVEAYKRLAQDLEKSGSVDLVVIQYYDYVTASQSERRSGVTSRTAELVQTYGINPRHIAIGTKHVGTANEVWTIASILEMWRTMAISYPDLRGIVTWESIVDAESGGQFAGQVAPAVRGAPSAC